MEADAQNRTLLRQETEFYLPSQAAATKFSLARQWQVLMSPV
jgi:hypothetical protein